MEKTKKNQFIKQNFPRGSYLESHPIRHIHCQIAASEFLTDFDSWDMLTIIGSRSPHTERLKKLKEG